MIVLGIDPDLHQTAFALVQDEPFVKILRVEVLSIPETLKGTDAVVAMSSALGAAPYRYAGTSLVVVEGQQIYLGSGQARPDSILRLAQVAGAALGAFWAFSKMMPRPTEWKGQVPKGIHQARILKRFGIFYKVVGREKGCVPLTLEGEPGLAGVEGSDLVPKGAWIHVVDAIGLALWAIEQAKSSLTGPR